MKDKLLLRINREKSGRKRYHSSKMPFDTSIIGSGPCVLRLEVGGALGDDEVITVAWAVAGPVVVDNRMPRDPWTAADQRALLSPDSKTREEEIHITFRNRIGPFRGSSPRDHRRQKDRGLDELFPLPPEAR